MTQVSHQVRVAVIGAGFGGLGVALKLRAAGHTNVVIYERADDIGGTWWYNTYPGAACDAPSHVYSYSFMQDVEWSRRFAAGAEIRAYLEHCVVRGGLTDAIQTGTEVSSARWTGREWAITLADGRTDRADVLVPAVGQLTVPAIPDLEGLERFSGPVFHTARWRHDVDLTGKRVGVVGTGASAIQVVPAITPITAHTVVFQRSAPYVFAKADVAYTDRLHRRYRTMPLLKVAARRGIWSYFEAVTVAFSRLPTVLSWLGRIHGRALRRHVSDPQLRAKLRPSYPIGCKRILISDDYYATLGRPDVTLETDPVVRVTESGIATERTLHKLDAIVFGTGFRTTSFVPDVSIIGRSGQTLAETWSERAAAFLGLSVPDFPNMFLVYGPNTNLGSGSIVYMLESQAAHIADAVDKLSQSAAGVIEVRASAHRKFLASMDKRQRHTVWRGCASWYTDARGQDTHNWPWLMSTYRRRTRTVRSRDYVIATGDEGPAAPDNSAAIATPSAPQPPEHR
ncbi:NAD(P)/FAD-dependent oxidoreductase [Mycolicibacterium farcinogenes]|uniref:flavin-containing monooxygenase n=1 Tax=Mycolicibacterium farcinogenes TaxID=1802 RepID=UPI001C8DAB5B|nr:NAD(P)/FAD-dependent oxidoreductase [Mycolicibacterium farcinogenes]QZH58429.1 NAD(P)/FAD-dependent oxidoreductase [Mycolicibacterium farcinogenes]